VTTSRKDFDAAARSHHRAATSRTAIREPPDPNKPSRPLLSPGTLARLGDPPAHPDPEFHRRNTTRGCGTINSSVSDLVFSSSASTSPTGAIDWRERFSVDLINGQPGRQLIYRRQRLVPQYLRVGFTEDGTWRTFSLRKDFAPAKKIQTEDDISASLVVPREAVAACTRKCATRRSSSSTANTGCSSARTTPSTAATTRKPRATSAAAACFSPTTSRSRAATRRSMVKDAIRFEQFTAADARDAHP
jgi:phosphoenolpyruvate carboxykinase (diphosphate)